MWHQRLRWVTYSLVAVLVIAGSLGLYGCNSDDDGPIGSETVRLTNATNERANVNNLNIQLLRDRGSVVADPFTPGVFDPVPGAVVIDAAAFAFDSTIAPDQLTATVLITNIRPIIYPTVTAATPFPPFVPSRTFGPSFASAEACPRAAPATVVGFPAPQVVANPIAAADYTIFRSDGVTYLGTLCIGAGTTGVVATPTSGPTLGAGGNICIFTNFGNPDPSNPVNPVSPGAQQVYTTCRIIVQTGSPGLPVPGLPVDGSTAAPATIQLTLSNPGPSGAGPLSQQIPVSVIATNNGNGTASISATDVNSVLWPTGVVVGLQ